MTSNPLRIASESDRKTDSEAGSNERTNERTDAADRIGRQSGAGSRRERAYQDSTFGPVSLSSAASGWLDEWEPKLQGERWPVVRSGERDPIEPHVRAAVWYRDGGRCAECIPEWPRSDVLHLDHIIPWSAGGPDATDNLRMLCESHNQERSNYVDFARPKRPATWWCLNCYSLDEHRWSYDGPRVACPRHGRNRTPETARCRVARAYAKAWKATGEVPTWHQRPPLTGGELVAYCAHCNAPGVTAVVL